MNIPKFLLSISLALLLSGMNPGAIFGSPPIPDLVFSNSFWISPNSNFPANSSYLQDKLKGSIFLARRKIYRRQQSLQEKRIFNYDYNSPSINERLGKLLRSPYYNSDYLKLIDPPTRKLIPDLPFGIKPPKVTERAPDRGIRDIELIDPELLNRIYERELSYTNRLKQIPLMKELPLNFEKIKSQEFVRILQGFIENKHPSEGSERFFPERVPLRSNSEELAIQDRLRDIPATH